jgi:hypothetical protein
VQKLKPFSRIAANAVKKYRNKVADVLDRAEDLSVKGLTRAFTTVGIPKKEAEAIANVIVSLLL